MTDSMYDIDFSDDLLRKLSDIEQKHRELTIFSYDQLNQEYGDRIKNSEKLGKHGWTVNYRKTPNDARE